MSGALGTFTNRNADPLGFARINELRSRLGLPLLDGQQGQSSGLGSLLGRPSAALDLPALPKIPKLQEPPSRLSTKQISSAARRQRQIAARRKGRASTILGGSVGADTEQKSLIGA